MNIVITPKPLHGFITIPSSKSMGHRELICAALAHGDSIVDNVTLSEDIEATCRVLTLLGARIQSQSSRHVGRTCFAIHGGFQCQTQALMADCGESGSTLRFLIPVGIMSGNEVIYSGRGRLAERPLLPYYTLFDQYGISYTTTNGALPLTVRGQLPAGDYALPGNVSSQFFTGLLLALPLAAGDSTVRSTTALESESYIALTLDCLRRHGITIGQPEPGVYVIPGNQQYKNGSFLTEGDFSQAAFWLTAGILGQAIQCMGLDIASSQGDKAIVSIIRQMGGTLDVSYDGITAHPSATTGVVIDAADCPDLVPIVTVLAACSSGQTHIVHAGRVRLKECDRLHAMAVELNKLGADIKEEPEGLVICGVPSLRGGRVQAWNDHRIAMALAVASQRCTGPLHIEGAECVRKSYPAFWQDFAALGGSVEQEV
jgi:3-phosphoshikimate 1-carboxyvinyltransferase